MQTTRRGFLGVTAATAATAAQAKPRRKRARATDVVVIGAGFAGLSAARALARAGKRVVVLEARDRVGGRALNLTLAGGEVTERGATFAGPTQDRILALANELGVPTFPTYDTGSNVYLNQGRRSTYPSDGPTGTAPLDPLILPELTATVALLDQLSTEVPVDAPWTAGKAAEYDGQTLETWINAHTATERFRHLVPAVTRPVFGAEPRELSLLFVLFYIAASGNESNPGTFERNFNTKDGAQMWRFEGGTQRIAQLAARDLNVLLTAPARRISQTAKGVTVESDGLTVKAKSSIVAIPPTLARADRLPPRASGRARPADAAARPGHADQGHRRVLHAVLARAGPDRHGRQRRRPRQRHVRRLAGLREARRPVRLRRRRQCPRVRADASRRRARSGARGAGHAVRRAGPQPDRVLRLALDERALDPRLPGRDRGPRHAARLRRRQPGAGRPDPLGRHGDVNVLERLHGRRRALGRASGRRGVERSPRLNSRNLIRFRHSLPPVHPAPGRLPCADAHPCCRLRSFSS